MSLSKLLDTFDRARKSPYSGDLSIGLLGFFAVRVVPAWLSAEPASAVEAGALGLGLGLISYSLDWMPARDEQE